MLSGGLTYTGWPSAVEQFVHGFERADKRIYIVANKKQNHINFLKVSVNKSIGLNIYSDSIIDKGMILSKRGNTTGKSVFWKKFKKQKVLKTI